MSNGSTLISQIALTTWQNDDAEGGYCARGVGNIVQAMFGPEYASQLRGHAYQWHNNLEAHLDWHRIDISDPSQAPPGAILVFDHDHPRGSGGGSRWGHVEIVAETGGERYYVSDRARFNSGGTVPDNFVGAYINPNLTSDADFDYSRLPAAIPVNRDRTTSYAATIFSGAEAGSLSSEFAGSASLMEFLNFIVELMVSVGLGPERDGQSLQNDQQEPEVVSNNGMEMGV